jgi:hypothetical protein
MPVAVLLSRGWFGVRGGHDAPDLAILSPRGFLIGPGFLVVWLGASAEAPPGEAP